MGDVDRSNPVAPVLVFLLDPVAQIFRRYRDPFRDDVDGLQVLEC